MKFRLPRMCDWGLVAAALVAAVILLAPQNGPVMFYKLALVTLAGVVGYWLDRRLFHYARPHELLATHPQLAGAAMLRRAIIVAAAMVGVTMGL